MKPYKSIKIYQDNNFTLLRLIAAEFVLVSHSYDILEKGLQQPGFFYNNTHLILSDFGLYIFFTISGYLVTQSLLDSNSLKHYLWKRFLRIIPALFTAICLCIVIGAFLTVLPIYDYLGNTATWNYLLKNITLVVTQYNLPGVFNSLHNSSVNTSIWTILVEVKFYIALMLIANHIVVRKWLYLSMFILFEGLRIFMHVNNLHLSYIDADIYFTYGTYFFLGSLFYCFKDNIPYKWFYANILMAVALSTVYTPFEPVTLSLFLAYCIIIIGTSKAVINFRGYDVSYGFYLYAFPIQQLLLLHFGYSVNIYFHILLSTVFSLLAGFLSFKFVEQPFLRKKNSGWFSK